MRKLIGRLLVGAATLAVLPLAQAVTLDFDHRGPGLLFDGDSFGQAGFLMTVDGSFGTLDKAAGLGTLAPTGNSTQFYSGLNDSLLLMERKNGGVFSLAGLDAAFIPPVPQGAGVFPGGLVIQALDKQGAYVESIVGFSSSGGDGKFAFTTYSGASFAAFNEVLLVGFSACVFTGSSCVSPASNLAQFALDNVNVSAAIPEPATALLLGLGLAGLALRSRRTAH